MTDTPVVDPLALVSGVPVFATIRDVKATPNPTGFVVTATTDVPILLQLDYWSQNDPSIPSGVGGTAPAESGATTQHSFVVGLGTGHTGYWFGFNFRLDSNDVSGYLWRPYQGLVQISGARVARGLSVPVRFYQFGGTPPAPAGGAGGNWNQYTWAQWNSKGTTYPTP